MITRLTLMRYAQAVAFAEIESFKKVEAFDVP
jgi:hypothetical protein